MFTLESLSDQDFARFQRMLFDITGIHLAPAKKMMVVGRLGRRLRAHRLESFADYFRLLQQRKDELQVAVDLLTTNETYFFREPRHFEFLSETVLAGRRRGTLRVWSAACSSGEEPYSIAMVLADKLGWTGWEVFGSDISTRMLERARAGIYPAHRAELIPPDYLRRFCLKGQGEHEGMLQIERRLRDKVQFRQLNLNARLPELGLFDLVLLRNVMIYFQVETKREVVRRVASTLRPGGYLFIGHSESLNGLDSGLEMVRPAVYRRPA